MLTQSVVSLPFVVLTCTGLLVILLVVDVVVIGHFFLREKTREFRWYLEQLGEVRKHERIQQQQAWEEVYRSEISSSAKLCARLQTLANQLARSQSACDEEVTPRSHARKAELIGILERICDAFALGASFEMVVNRLLSSFDGAIQDLEAAEAAERSSKWEKECKGWQQEALQRSACPVAFGHVFVSEDEAAGLWVDFVGASFLSKKTFLLRTLQQCIVEESSYRANARRKLAARPDADVTHEFRKILMLWATSQAIRFILSFRRDMQTFHFSKGEVTDMFLDEIAIQTGSFLHDLQEHSAHVCALLQEYATHAS